MAAYCYFDILKVHNESLMQLYREKVLNTVDHYGGRYVIIGGPFQTKEGTLHPTFPVLIEFPTLEKANEWYNSEAYTPLKELPMETSMYNIPGVYYMNKNNPTEAEIWLKKALAIDPNDGFALMMLQNLKNN